MKTSETLGKDQINNEKLKESIKSMKVFHQDQIRTKDGRVNEQNSTIKSLKSKANALEKSLLKLNYKFTECQRKSATDIAELEYKREIIEIKDKQQRKVIMR